MNAPHQQSRRKATNISLDAHLLEEARGLGVNLSRACERGLQEEVRRARAEKWLAENSEAIAQMNAWVERHGLPLADLRQF